MNGKPSQLVRVASNYARLLGTVAIGFFLVRALLRFGGDAFGLIALLGSGTGIGLIIQEVVRVATVPILGAAWHDKTSGRLDEVFNSALTVSFFAGIATLVLYGVMMLCLPFFTIPPELQIAARWFLLAMALNSFFSVFLSPLLNFYAVSERMFTFNLTIFLTRVADLAAALLTLLLVSPEQVSRAIVVYGFLYSALATGLSIAVSWYALRTEPRLNLAPRLATRSSMRAFTGSAGWNAGVTLAMSLYSRADMVIFNLFFGLFGSLVFGLANQVTFYIRRVMTGLIAGIDSVSARVASTGGTDAVVRLMCRSAGHQAIVIFPMLFGLLLFTRPFVNFWVGDRIENIETTGPVICSLIRILAIGASARCLSEGWLKIMSGEGKVRIYAPWIVVGGILNPVLAVVAIHSVAEPLRFFAPAVVFTVLLVIVHLVVIPVVIQRTYSISLWQIFSPFFRPLSAAAISAIPAWMIMNYWSFPPLDVLVSVAVFALLLAVLGFGFVLPGEDRDRIRRWIGIGPRSAGAAQ